MARLPPDVIVYPALFITWRNLGTDLFDTGISVESFFSEGTDWKASPETMAQ